MIGLIVLLVLITMESAYQYWSKTPLRRWRRDLQLAEKECIFNTLYAPINGFLLSKSCRSTSDAIEYVYGEICFEPFIALLSLCKPNENSVFYDLGSGTGKAVIAAAIVFNVKRSIGVECLSSLHEAALEQKDRLMSQTAIPGIEEQIQFIHDDLNNLVYTDATLIFINATAFFGEVWQAISTLLEQIPPDAYVISTSKPLISKQFLTVKITYVEMSWGIVTAYIQKRLVRTGKKHSE